MEYRKATGEELQLLTDKRIEFLEAVNPKTCDGGIRRSIEEYFKRNLANGSVYEVPPSILNVSGRAAYISNMYTIKGYRHRGICHVLFQKLIDEAKARGCGRVYLNATDMGKPIYEGFGFKPAGDQLELLMNQQPDNVFSGQMQKKTLPT
jgi:GNAT superfamily N-acetyltransferase